MKKIWNWLRNLDSAVVFMTICLLLGIGLFILGFAAEKKNCYTRYAEYNPEYVGMFTGCMITTDSGKRISIENFIIAEGDK